MIKVLTDRLLYLHIYVPKEIAIAISGIIACPSTQKNSTGAVSRWKQGVKSHGISSVGRGRNPWQMDDDGRYFKRPRASDEFKEDACGGGGERRNASETGNLIEIPGGLARRFIILA